MLTIEQVMALIIFVCMFIFIIFDKIERQYVTLFAALLTIIVTFGICMRSPSAIMRALNIQHFNEVSFWFSKKGSESKMSGINWETIIFITGMMIMVEKMGKSGFFKWLCMKIAKLVKYKPISLMVSFMIMSFGLAMFIDSITVILFLAAVTVELAQLLKLDPVPMILSEIFCANLGGSATMCGDPPNIIIGTTLHYSFKDFIKNTGVIALMSLVAIVIYFLLVYRKELVNEQVTQEDIEAMPEAKEVINSQKDFLVSCVIFLLAVILLITHERTGVTVGFIGVFIAILTLITDLKDSLDVLKKIDYKTLLFFIGLFVVVSGLEETGLLKLLAKQIEEVSGGNTIVIVAIIIWVSGIASAVVDNIPFAATMIPVIRSLAVASGVDLAVLVWALALGTDVGGSATPIGASANVVGTSVAIKNGYIITWGKYCKTSIPATVIVMFISMGMIIIRYCL
ncbi:SLC13 family permease [Lachnobacterium bovis]|uniref:SLC13 family permease n=1 Tax=Lachnobacterium bovis TaxID=140626 RepID=UPI00054D829E|nr:ArsB/NhaD family transporter [Lachnobacterium bovis]